MATVGKDSALYIGWDVGVWSDGNNLSAIEAYPSACKTSASIEELLQPYINYCKDEMVVAETIWDNAVFIDSINHEDKRDALLCAIISLAESERHQCTSATDLQRPLSEGWIFVPNDLARTNYKVKNG